jgi:hypothetical protein
VVPLGIAPPSCYTDLEGSIDMAVAEDMDWVVIPQHPEDSEYFYGCRALHNYRLFIASGCCAALMLPHDFSARCSKCKKIYPISAHPEHPGEDEPFIFNWGQFSWDEVDGKMASWIDYYFNLSAKGSVEIKFNHMTSVEYTTSKDWEL